MRPILYLAAAYSRKFEIRHIAHDLACLGLTVNSRWLFEPEIGYPTLDFKQDRAKDDVEDVTACDILVRFSDDLSADTVPSRLASGARMFEMGLAYSLKKSIIVISGYQCIFDYLPGIIHLSDLTALKTHLVNNVIGGTQWS